MWSACGASIPALPSAGGPAWMELKSPHFVLWTDASAARGRQLVEQMELRRQLIARAMNRAPQGRPIFAIALNGEREMRAFVPETVLAQAWSEENATLEPGILLNADSPEQEQAIAVNHELAHAISFSILPHQPRWLAEGLAGYFETVELDPETGTTTFGFPSREELNAALQFRLMPVEQVLSCEGTACENPEFYAASWALLAYLIDTRLDQFNLYLQRLKTLRRAQHLRAWEETFPDLSGERLDGELRSWLHNATFKVPKIAIKPERFVATQRPLRDADALAARASLHLVRGQTTEALAEARAALAREPTHLLASLTIHALRPVTAANARAVTIAHPNEWRAWWLLASALHEDTDAEELTASVARLCALRGKGLEICDPAASGAAR
jgi:hypothetical protein